MKVTRFVILLTEDIWAMIWQAYENDVMVIINELEFLDIGDYLMDNPDKIRLCDLILMYPDNEDFDKLLLPILKEETFICEYYKD